MDILSLIQGSNNPEQLVYSMLEQRLGGTPMGRNLLALAGKRDAAGVEQVARNLLAQQGVDFDKEFAKFKQQLRL